MGARTLGELAKRHPQEWAAVKELTTALLKGGDPERINAAMLDAHARSGASACAERVRARLELLAIESRFRAALAGTPKGEVRLGKRDMTLAREPCLARLRDLPHQALDVRRPWHDPPGAGHFPF
jgi:hypothetical protein